MFTGIVQGIGQIIDIKDKKTFRSYTLKYPANIMGELNMGASIANDGCCLTVKQYSDNNIVSFDLMDETLSITTLGQKSIGDFVNVERAIRFGDEIGGHLMSGHITCKGIITEIISSENNYQLTITIPDSFSGYIFYKGFVGIDGISLTVGEVINNQFKLHIIPETLKRTTIGLKKQGEEVNIEIDPQTQAIVDTVTKILQNQVTTSA